MTATVALCRGNSHLIEERDRVIHLRYILIAASPSWANGKLEIHLRWHVRGHGGHRLHTALMVAA